MSFVGEATGVFGLLGKTWSLLRDRLDPARAQAKRLIETLETYGVARQQIPRLLPHELKLPNAAFSTPDKLKDKVTPELLDWAAGYLAISRSWLDGIEEMSHLVEDHYKSPEGYREWLANRLEVAPTVSRFLAVLKPLGQEIPSGHGPLCLTYEETTDGLDGSEFTRYWLLSDQWSLHHAPCLENLLAVIAVARSLGVRVLGSDIPLRDLQQLEAGKKLIPEVMKSRRGQWHPEDLVDPLPGKDSEWRQALWTGAQGYLAKAGMVAHDLDVDRPAAMPPAPRA
ncbi:hypothetical protein BSY239_3405 [Hydrogenophaga sp. RAC07]|uniref:hypothetical protein n=1 Tax=Hydrogenophaga sp. RAC07 TaxID=1842537 RepID=UPI00083CB5A2|nr:hypothetical protein [Hydrogenophaga sp. RAC07]AOF87620.1 hypothetical protein BSY239_3405 [Hydrogenophaga sp. RAC07]